MRMLIAVLVAVLALAFAGAGNAQERTVSVNGMQMHYRTLGEGPPLVLLHYYGACGTAWQPHLEVLSRHYKLIVPDMRGHGRSTNPSGEFTHRQSARDMFALLDHLGIKQFKAMGISSGGMTLLHMATQQPSRVDAMVLIGATTQFPEQARAILRASAPGATLTAAQREEFGSCSTRGDAQTRELMTLFHRFKDSYDDMNFTEPYLSTITARTLVVHGDRDEFFPLDIAVGMQRAIPRSSLWIIPNAGHIPILGTLAPAFQAEALAFLAPEWKQR